MIKKAGDFLIALLLTFAAIGVATAYGGNFTWGAGAVIGFSVGFAKTYTPDNTMFSIHTFIVLLGCILGGTLAGARLS